MASIKVTSEELRSQGVRVSTGADDVNTLLTRLQGEVSDLAGRWEGAASGAFQDRFNTWQTSAQGVQRAMTDIATFLSQAADAYEQAEETIRQAAGS